MKKFLVLWLVIVLLLPLGVQAKPGNEWVVPDDFATIQEAIDSASVVDGDVIRVRPGSHAGAYVSKMVTIKGMDGAIIDSGPMHPAGLSMGFRMSTLGSGQWIRYRSRYSVSKSRRD